MCGRYTRYSSWAEVYAFTRPLDVRLPDHEAPPQYNIAPSQIAWVIAADAHGRLAAQEMRWGFLPRWAKDPKMPRPINARAEAVATSGMFRGSFADRRCLVLANGWYEWRAEDPASGAPATEAAADGAARGAAKPVKQPYYFAPADGTMLAFAGLFDVVRTPDGHDRSFAILTCAAGAVAGAIHDRMPLALDRADLDLWLDPRAEKRDLEALLDGAEPPGLTQVRVSREVNSPKHDTPSLVAAEPLRRDDGPTDA
jgi:putative SOS response-associated peptidase YedK